MSKQEDLMANVTHALFRQLKLKRLYLKELTSRTVGESFSGPDIYYLSFQTLWGQQLTKDGKKVN